MNIEPGPEKYAELIIRAWNDPAFKAALLADPVAVLRHEGWPVPEGKQVRVVENTPYVTYLVLPENPDRDMMNVDMVDELFADGRIFLPGEWW